MLSTLRYTVADLTRKNSQFVVNTTCIKHCYVSLNELKHQGCLYF